MCDMTTLMIVDGDRDESRSQAVARRLRGELAERRISVSEVARRINMTQGALSRRMTGNVEFGVDLIDPSPVPLRQAPRDADSWVTAAAGRALWRRVWV